jgi:hypothetical protein
MTKPNPDALDIIAQWLFDNGYQRDSGQRKRFHFNRGTDDRILFIAADVSGRWVQAICKDESKVQVTWVTGYPEWTIYDLCDEGALGRMAEYYGIL